ncbi:MAG: NAD(P)H-hydrate dehydratase [Bacteroidales bacterium]|nr:NAD(P)H-hydrate dehydratase [Bacteroidales bacterium]
MEDYASESSYLLPTVEETRKCEQHTMEHEPIPSIQLMERAGCACAEHVLSIMRGMDWPSLFVFCGTGNNGGDGLVIARKLQAHCSEHGFDITVVVCQSTQPHYSPEMEANLNLWKELLSSPHTNLLFWPLENPIEIPDDSLIVDAIFGIGLNKPAIGAHKEAIEAINKANAYTIAIDVPSGLFCDQHTPMQNAIVMADTTLAIQYPKLAFMMGEAFAAYGDVRIIDIQMFPPRDLCGQHYLITRELVSRMLRDVHPYSNKGTFGHGLLIAGSGNMPGAAIMSATAAMRGGIGKLTVHTTENVIQILPAVLPEAILSKDENPDSVSRIDWEKLSAINALAIGPGLGTSAQATNLIKDVLDSIQSPIILDADALNMLANHKTWIAFLPPNSILTPHPKEFERLTGVAENDFDRAEKARHFAMQYGVVLILKGHHTIVNLPDGTQYFNLTGNVGMATAGSGDVLTGLLLALKAQGYSSAEAAIIGVHIHGLAGDLYSETQSYRSLIASDISANFGKAFQIIDNLQH